jgi:hypothetical protein
MSPRWPGSAIVADPDPDHQKDRYVSVTLTGPARTV